MKPLIKYPGGKMQMLDTLLPLVSGGRRHVEPFVGGGAIALAIDAPVVAGDVDEDLVEMYDVVRHSPIRLSGLLQDHANAHSVEHYYAVRADDPFHAVERVARTMYLNRAGFNGLWRKNKSGRFNVPIGRGDPHHLPGLRDLMETSRRLRRWDISRRDFEDTIGYADAGDVIYADPPYDSTFDYSSGFDVGDRERLRDCLRRARVRGARAVVTDADTPLVRDLYRGWSVTEVTERRRVGARTREAAACLIIVGEPID